MRVQVKTDKEGEPIIEIPQEWLEELGWQEGDELKWVKNEDDSFSLFKLT